LSSDSAVPQGGGLLHSFGWTRVDLSCSSGQIRGK
jgi:hypothetical protein